MTSYKVLFVGGLYEKDKEDIYLGKSKKGIQNAVNIHQWNIIKSIEIINEKPVDILSARYLDSFPRYKDVIVRQNKWSHRAGSEDENIFFVNLPIIKSLFKTFLLWKKTRKWVKTTEGKKIVVCYYPGIPQMIATTHLKNKDIRTVLIIPDIPKYMDLQQHQNNNIFRKYLKSKIENYQNKLIRAFDGYIVLTENMKEIINNSKKSVVIEGFVDKDFFNKEGLENNANPNSIVYCGSLHKNYGLDLYLKSIEHIKSEKVEFYFFGSGEMEDDIISASKKDKRIKFFGYQTSDTVRRYCRNSLLLINPRRNDKEFTKYSFPSKLIEYMASGRPVISTKLECIPPEYDKHLIYVEDPVNSDNIAKTINSTLNKTHDELNVIGKNAREFILSTKTAECQGKKIGMLFDEIFK